MTWMQRLKRVFGIDIEICERCGEKVKIIASIEDPAVIAHILKYLQQKEALKADIQPPDSSFHLSMLRFPLLINQRGQWRSLSCWRRKIMTGITLHALVLWGVSQFRVSGHAALKKSDMFLSSVIIAVNMAYGMAGNIQSRCRRP